MDAELTPQQALGPWRRHVVAGGGASGGPEAPLEQTDDGLINRTFFVGDPATHVLQWVNPIFDRRIQLDIDAVTRHLAAAGWVTPRLVPTDDGVLEAPDGGGFWRLMTFIPGVTHHRLRDVRMASAVGELVGRFHATVAASEIELKSPARRVHQTGRRMDDLKHALDGADGHPLEAPAREVGASILAAWRRWDGCLDLPDRLCHGDLKVSNIRFAGDGGVVCLLDLDTLGPQDYSAEMGDAWRSWCNPAGEEEPNESYLDVDLFEASARAWLRSAPPLDPAEREALVPGIERISLELAARFCADAVQNRYFQEDRRRFVQPGSHNLQKARAQLNFARSAHLKRSECERRIEGVR